MPLSYRGGINGPLGRIVISQEQLLAGPEWHNVVFDRLANNGYMQRVVGLYPTRLVLSQHAIMGAASFMIAFLSGTQFYDCFALASDRVRRPVVLEQTPRLREDFSNLSSVLHSLQTEEESAFEAIERMLSLLIADFRWIYVRARGGPGEVLAFINIGGVELTIARSFGWPDPAAVLDDSVPPA